MASKPLRQREDSCCHNCPDHKEVTFSPDGKAITCRMGCAKWAAFEEKTAMRRDQRTIEYQGTPDMRQMEQNIRKQMRRRMEGRAI